MADKSDRSSKDDFNRAVNGAPENDKAAGNPVPPQAGFDQGPKPPGGDGPRQSTVDRHRAARQAQADKGKSTPGMSKDDPSLSRNFDSRSKR